MEKYLLGQSKSGYISDMGNEVRLDITLEANPYYGGTLIHGFVENVSTGEPLANVCITCYSPCGFIIGHAYSNQCGLYFIPNVGFKQKVCICALKPGFTTYYSPIIYLKNPKEECINIYMKQIRKKTCTICGHVYNSDFNDIVNAKVYLTDPCKKVICSTITNEYGQFVCDRVPNGFYCISVEHRYYEQYVNSLCVGTKDDLIPYRVVLADCCY